MAERAKLTKHKATGVIMMNTPQREISNEWESVEVAEKEPTTAKPKAKAKAKAKKPAKVAEPSPPSDDDIDGLLDDAVDD